MQRGVVATIACSCTVIAALMVVAGCNWFSKEARFVGRWEAPGEALDLKADGEGLWQRHDRNPAKQRVVWSYWRGDSAVLVLKSKYDAVQRMKAARKGDELPGDNEVIVTLRDTNTLLIQKDGELRFMSRPK